MTGRLRAIGSIAVSMCQVAATRVDGMATLLEAAARSTPPRRSSSSARAAARSPSRRRWTIRSARRSTSSRARPSWPPAPTARWPSWPRCPRSGWSTGAWPSAVAEAVAGADRTGRPPAGGADLDAMAARAREHVTAYRPRAQPAVPPPPQEVDRGARNRRANLETMRGDARARARAPGASGPPAARSAACSSAPRSRARSAAVSGPQRARPVRAGAARSGAPAAAAARRRPTSRGRARASRPTRRAARRGSSSTRSPTRCSSRAVPWLREHLAAMLRELLSSVKVEVDPSALLRLPKHAGPARGVGLGARGRARRTRSPGPSARTIIDRLQADMAPHRGPRRARRWTRAGAAVLPVVARAARVARAPAAREAAAGQAARAPARPRPQAAPVRPVGKRFCDAVVRPRRGGSRRLDRARAGALRRAGRRRGRARRHPAAAWVFAGAEIVTNRCSFCNRGSWRFTNMCSLVALRANND